MKKAKPAKKRTGPKPERVKIQGDWESAVSKALSLKRPKEGWPAEPEKKKGRN